MQNKFYNLQLVILLLLGTSFNLSAQSWIGGPWSYRRIVTISNPGATILTDYQVKITIDNTFDFPSANSDGSDIRIADSDEVTPLLFWIEEWNTAQSRATIWVKVPSVPIGGTSIYLYYGNNAATTESDGTNTFKFFDDFSTNDFSGENWIRKISYDSGIWEPGTELPHDWKYSSEMLHGALEYVTRNFILGLESLDTEIEQEFNFIHSQINPNGSVVGDKYLTSEPQYCYGLILSNLAAGYYYLVGNNPTLANRCYNDMVLVFDYLSITYPNVSTPFPNDAGGNGWLLMGYSNAWRSLNDQGDAVRASLASTIVQNYSATFISSQAIDGSWTGATNVQENLKRDFGLLWAHQVTNNISYLTAVKDNIEYILNTFWISSNGGLEMYPNQVTSDRFYEYNQQLFMVATRRLNGRSGGIYDYTAQGEQAWHFLTDNNYAGIDLYVHNYINHNAFFSYHDVQEDGTFQDVDLWKGSNEIGTALWGMVLNYDWVSSYQSSHSSQAYNYLDMMVKQIKNSPTNRGFFREGGLYPSSALWNRMASPTISIIQDSSYFVASFSGTGTEEDLITSVDSSFDNFILEMKVKLTADTNNSCTPEIGFRYTDSDNRYLTTLRGESQNDLYLSRYESGVQTSPLSFPSFNYTTNNYYKYKIVANSSIIEQHLDDSLIRSWNDAGTGTLSGRISLTNLGGINTNPVYYDDVRIRSYAAIEPTTSVSANRESNPLPVELSTLSAVVIGSSVKLNWRTETEINNFGFEIERSESQDARGEKWDKIGFVNGNGNSNSPKNYTFKDNGLLPGKYSYRLKQIDNDGQFEYSKNIEVDFNSPKKFELTQNYPNPFNPVTTISWEIPTDGLVTLKIYDILGKEIYTVADEYQQAGSYQRNFDGSSLSSGMYFFTLQSGSFIQTRKMILMK